MTLSIEDRLDIAELVNRHGHLVDEGALERMGELFTDDVVYDVTDLGGGVLAGLARIETAARELGAGNPVAHHVTNVVVAGDGDGATVLSKGIGISVDGRVSSVTYADRVVRTGGGWRISHRTVRLRRVPLTR